MGIRENSVCRMELAYVTEDISKMTFKLKLAKLGTRHVECGEKNTPGKRNDLSECQDGRGPQTSRMSGSCKYGSKPPRER